MPWLDAMADFYGTAHITDMTFLRMRNLSSSSVFLQESLPLIQRLKGPEGIIASRCRPLHDRVDEDGKAPFETMRIPH